MIKLNVFNFDLGNSGKHLIHIMNNYVYKYLYLYFIGFSLLLFVFSLLTSKRNQTSRINKIRKRDVLFKILTSPITLFASLISPKSEKKKQRYSKTFRRLGINITVERFHLIKATMPLVAILFIFLVHFTNSDYEIQEVLNTPITASADITSESDIIELQDNLDNYQIFKTIEAQYEDYKSLEKLILAGPIGLEDRENIIKEFSSIIQANYKLDETLSEGIGEYLLIKYPEIVGIRTIEYTYYLIALSTIFIPDFILFFINVYNRKRYREDIEMLKITTLIVGSLEGMTVKKILQSLKEVSPSYRHILNNALNNYSSMQDGKEDAIMSMTEEVKLPQFRKLCSILKEISTGNKTTAINNLNADMILEDKESEMINNDKIEKKTWVAILIIGPSMLFLMMLLLMPFAKYYENMQF